jgi:alanine-glyoxylate transaminase/serine-glyoxylate transaminase/serine-pyruvate transaminase
VSSQNPIFIPGPTNMPDNLRSAMNVQTSDHRAPDFEKILSPMLTNLKKVFKTETGQVITFPASGTGGWEASITNTLSPGDKVLVARYGTFSHRWIGLCQRHGLLVEILECEWGTGAPADRFAERLAADKAQEIKAVLVTHNETATGVLSNITDVRSALDASSHPALLFVDCVSSLACMDFRMDEWGVDLAVAGSQKGFMLTAGMAIVAVSEKAMLTTQTSSCPRTFFDFNDMLSANAKGGYPYTPPLQLIHGMHASLEMLFEEGLDNVFSRHFRLAEGIRKAVSALGLSLCASSSELYSDTVSAIYVPDGFNSDALTNHAYNAYDVSFGVGLGEMAGKAFRIGHLGSLTDVMALSGIATIEMAMKDLNYPIKLGQGVAAAQEYYRNTLSSNKQQTA